MMYLAMHRQCFLNAQEAFEYVYGQIIRYGYYTQIGTKALYDVGFYIEQPLDNNIETRWRKWNPCRP